MGDFILYLLYIYIYIYIYILHFGYFIMCKIPETTTVDVFTVECQPRGVMNFATLNLMMPASRAMVQLTSWALLR